MPLGQLLHRVQNVPDEGERPVSGRQLQVRRRQTAQQRHADVGGRGPPGQSHGRLFLPVVRRQPVVLRPEELSKILPDQGRLVEQEGPILLLQPPRPGDGAAHGPGKDRRGHPHQSDGGSDWEPGTYHAEQPRRHRWPHFLVIGPESVSRSPFRLCGGGPGQEFLVGHPHPPQGGEGGAGADPGLIGQEQKLHQRLEENPSKPRNNSGVVALRKASSPPEGQIGPGKKQMGGGGQDRHPRRRREHRPGQAHTQHQGQQGGHRHQAAAQVVEELPLGDGPHGVGLPPAVLIPDRPAQPGQKLPIPSHPAVESGKIRGYLIGIAVGKLHVSDESRPEIGALQQIVGQNGIFGKPPVQAGEKHVHVEDALAGIGALIKEVVIHVAGGRAVGVHPSLAGEDAGELGVIGRLQLHPHPRLEQTVAGDHHPTPGVHSGPVHGVQHGADQLPGGAHAQAGVRVQRDDIAGPLQRRAVPGQHLQAGTPPLQQPDQLDQGPALALPAHVALVHGMESGPAEKEIKPAAVFGVQTLHGISGRLRPAALRLSHGAVPVRQVGQKAEAQLRPRVPIGQPIALQQGGQLVSAVPVGEQAGDDTQGPPLLRHPLLQRQPVDRSGMHQTHHQEVGPVLHYVGYRQKQQHRRPQAVQPEPQQ